MSSIGPSGEERPDGFRPRKRPPGWYEQALADGTVRAPDAPDPDDGKDYSNATVVAVPLARASGEGT